MAKRGRGIPIFFQASHAWDSGRSGGLVGSWLLLSHGAPRFLCGVELSRSCGQRGHWTVESSANNTVNPRSVLDGFIASYDALVPLDWSVFEAEAWAKKAIHNVPS